MMTPEAMRGRVSDSEELPALPFDSWKDTQGTLHMWAQIVGKVRLKLCPLVNHWWNVPFYVTARGMTTSAMPYQQRAIEVHFDFIDHRLIIESSDGRVVTMPPEPPGGDAITREAYSPEVSSAGFWPGGGDIKGRAFYSYAAREPPGFAERRVRPEAAFYHPQMKEFLLMYDDVRAAASPKAALMEFLQSTYDAAADLGKWDRKSLERQVR